VQLRGAVVLVTGANRGIGREFAQAALARGASKVYAAARNPSLVDLHGVQPLRLDVTSDDDVAAAVAQCADVTVVVNNAGIANFGAALASDSLASLQAMLDVNCLGILRVSRAFAPVLASNGGGAFLNVLSVASFIHRPPLGLYATTKAAAWGLTNVLRHELRAQGTQVTALHMGFVDTQMVRDVQLPKSSPADIVARAFDGLESGAEEVLADDRTRQVHAGLAAPLRAYLAP
jgi:NAD(P)-dependent dehydrogenase (short-subunit alcohol dehydrogenase family)